MHSIVCLELVTTVVTQALLDSVKTVSEVRIALLEENLAICVHAPQVLITYRRAGHVLAEYCRNVCRLIVASHVLSKEIQYLLWLSSSCSCTVRSELVGHAFAKELKEALG